MVIAYTLKFAVLPVQVESFVGNVFNAADTETCGVSIYQFIIRINFRDSLVKRRTFRRPEFGRVYNKILFKRLSVIDAACILFPGNNFIVFLSKRQQCQQ